MHGSEEAIGRDVLFKGTALSAPVSMLLTQAAMTATVARRPSRHATQALGGLEATLVAGYLGERLVRQRLRPSGWDPVESPLLLVAIGLAMPWPRWAGGSRGTARAEARRAGRCQLASTALHRSRRRIESVVTCSSFRT
jgi:hypothetical protein